MSVSTNNDFFKSTVLGHPSGLFVLFFTEMWERFSFYGMRVLLINFLTMAAIGTNPGWEFRKCRCTFWYLCRTFILDSNRRWNHSRQIHWLSLGGRHRCLDYDIGPRFNGIGNRIFIVFRIGIIGHRNWLL